MTCCLASYREQKDVVFSPLLCWLKTKRHSADEEVEGHSLAGGIGIGNVNLKVLPVLVLSLSPLSPPPRYACHLEVITELPASTIPDPCHHDTPHDGPIHHFGTIT